MKTEPDMAKDSDDVEALRTRVGELESMLDICAYLSSSLDLHTILTRIVEVCQSLLKADAASILLLDENLRELSFEVVSDKKGQKLQGMRLTVGEGIAGKVAQS